MMRIARLFAVGLALLVTVGLALGQDTKEKVVDGSVCCAKCELKVPAKPSAPPSSRSRKAART